MTKKIDWVISLKLSAHQESNFGLVLRCTKKQIKLILLQVVYVIQMMKPSSNYQERRQISSVLNAKFDFFKTVIFEPRAASVVGIPKIGWFSDFFQNLVFLKWGKNASNWVKIAQKGIKIRNSAQKSAKFDVLRTFLFKRG